MQDLCETPHSQLAGWFAFNVEIAAGLIAMRSIGYAAGWSNKKTVEEFCEQV